MARNTAPSGVTVIVRRIASVPKKFSPSPGRRVIKRAGVAETSAITAPTTTSRRPQSIT